MKRTVTVTAAVLLAALAALSACSSSDDGDKDDTTHTAPTTKAASPGVDNSAAEKKAGIPPEPTGAARDNVLAVLFDVNPVLVADEEDAIDNARNQCAAINGGAERLEWSAQQRFSSSAHEVTEDEAKHINIGLAEFCKTA
ncbi:hypothetical protein ACFW5I_24960 [Streptomyces sp. NPDC058818]|uniref:hypothetical protein n=1 Tax=Streptomyces sp. NPDC058818 TaxID=3346640 RepID=UPI0036AA7726